MPSSLYTSEDIKKVRRELFDLAKGVDPILRQEIDFNDSVLDHCHTTQHCRAAIHRQSNAFEGLVFNAYKRCLQWLTDEPLPVILRNLAEYLEQSYDHNPYHNGWLKKVKTRFNKLNAENQKRFLNSFGYEQGTNGAQRSLIFGKLIKNKEYGYEVINERLSEYENN